MKRIISLLVAVVMLMGLMSMTVSAAFGDANADGSATVQDVALLQQYLADWDVTLDTATADLNADGAVTVRDLAILQQYLAGWDVIPNVTLPAIGTDIDVVNKRNRIRVSAASATIAESGNFEVSLTFQNYNSRYITEETNWVEYTCYGADGSVVQKATKIYIGCIDTKNYKIRTFNFEVPSTTTEIKLTNSKIVYWTEWA